MNNKGFTMAELLVAMAILGLLIIMAFPTLRAVQTNNTNKKYDAYGDVAISAAKLYIDSYGDDLFDPDRTNDNKILYLTKLKEKNLLKDIGISDSTCIEESNVKIIKYNNDYTYCLHLVCKTGNKTVYTSDDERGACKNFDTTTVSYTYKGVTKTIEVVKGDDHYKLLTPDALGFNLAANHEVFQKWIYNGNEYDAGSIFPSPINSSITFEVKKRPWQYKIIFKKNTDATYSGTMTEQTCDYGANCILKENNFSRTGYHFKNWYRNSSTSYNDKENVRTSIGNHISSDGAKYYLTGIFEINKCTVTFDPNGGVFGTNNSNRTQVIEYDKYMGDNPVVNGMRNANGGYYTATRTGYKINAATAWTNGTATFDERKSYLAQDVCNLSSGNNATTLKVNWVLDKPTCSITVSNSPASNGDWYTENVTIKMTTSGVVSSKGLATTSGSTNGKTEITINTDGEVTYYGNVTNSAGSGSCSKKIKLDKSPPTCTSSGGSSKWKGANNEEHYAWVALSQTIKGTCSDSVSGVKKNTVSEKYEKSKGSINTDYSPGTCENNAGLKTTCPKVRVKVTGNTLSDYESGAVFMFDGKTDLSNTEWKDKSGHGNHGKLLNEVSKKGNAIYCTGNNTPRNSYIRLKKFNYSSVTIESVYKSEHSNSDSEIHSVVDNFHYGGYGISIISGKSMFYIWKGSDYATTPGVSTGNNIAYFSGAGNNSMVKTYINNTYSYKAVSGNVGYPTHDEPFIICSNPYYSGGELLTDIEFFKGYVYAVRFYNKVLTDEQMQKHNVIDKSRFS